MFGVTSHVNKTTIQVNKKYPKNMCVACSVDGNCLCLSILFILTQTEWRNNKSYISGCLSGLNILWKIKFVSTLPFKECNLTWWNDELLGLILDVTFYQCWIKYAGFQQSNINGYYKIYLNDKPETTPLSLNLPIGKCMPLLDEEPVVAMDTLFSNSLSSVLALILALSWVLIHSLNSLRSEI